DILPAAQACGALVIEDAAQCQGARRQGRTPASLGMAAATSFYPGKNLGAYGDAGAVTTNDTDLAHRLRLLRNHGGEARYEHLEVGFNSRMDTLQAVVLLAKLARLERWNQMRREAATLYHNMLVDADGVQLPVTLPGNEHVWHLYVVRVSQRDGVARLMQEDGIGVGVHYPVPIHLLEPFAFLGHHRGDFPLAETAAEEILSLPMYPGITPAIQERVVESLRRAVAGT
ncbi:MAG: DegT/DnrJ/EryC1/StrS family aminotransferase, partial [Acidimicrobiales bacterium]